MLKILQGDCLKTLPSIPGGSIDCVVTSPPYFGLRDYDVDGQIGREPHPDEFVQALVCIFREVRRALKDTGTVWLNLGDSYASTDSKGNSGFKDGRANRSQRRSAGVPAGIKQKDLIGIPWRVAFALQEDGWYLRQDVIWNKPNCMPESAKDRCVKSHEYVFLLTKNKKYYFDHEIIKEALAPGSDVAYRNKLRKNKQYDQKAPYKKNFPAKFDEEKRNRRSVWNIPTKPYKGAHFAAFPVELVKPCIQAGCPEMGTVLDPFGGSGTTAGVALALNRKAILCELNPDYIKLVPERISDIIQKELLK